MYRNDKRIERFSPIHARKASDEVLAVMVDALRGGLYEPGDTLPSQEALAIRLNVSRRVVREAIDVLRDEEIVTVKRGAGGGMIVASTANLARVTSRIKGPTRASLLSVLEARRLVECHSTYIVAATATPDDIAVMKKMVRSLEEVNSIPQEFWETDIRFHFFIADCTRNSVLGDSLREIFDRLAVLRQPFPYAYVPHTEALENQHDTLRAIKSKDPLAALRAIDDHLASLEMVLLGIRLPIPFGIQFPASS